MASSDASNSSGEALPRSEGAEGWYLSLLRNTADVVTILAADNTVLYDSPAIGRVLGYAPNERVGDKGFDYVHPDDRERVGEAFTELLRKPSIDVPLEYRIRHKDGSWRHVEAMRTNLLDDPAVGGVVVVYRDVTGRKRAEEALKESEEKYRSIFENAAEGIYQTTPKGHLIGANPALVRLFGYASVEEMVETMPDVKRGYVDPDRREEFVRLMRENETVSGFEYRVYRKDGSVAWVSENARAVRNDGGALLHYEGFLEDVTDRKKAEAALRGSEEQYRRLVETVQEGIAFVDGEERITYCNPAYAEVFGLTPAELAGRSLLEFLDEGQRRKAVEQTALRRKGESSSYELSIVAADGREKILSASGSPITDTDGAFQGAVHAIVDITERRRAEEALKESEERFRSLVQNASDMISILNSDGTIRYVSPSVERVLGYRPEERVGADAFGEETHPDDAEEMRSAFAKGLGRPGGVSPPLEFRVRRKDGSWRRLEAVATNRTDHAAVRGIVVNARDVTESKEAEQRLRESEEGFRTLVEEVPAVTYVHRQRPGEASTTEYVSPQVEAVLGYTPEEYASDPRFWETLLHPEDRDRILDEDERTGATGEPFREDFRMIAKDGRVVWLREEGNLVRVERDGTEIWHGVMFDITELKETERRLREAEEDQRRRARELELLHRVRTALSRELDPEEVLHAVVEAVAEAYGYTLVSAYLLEGASPDRELVMQHQVGYRTVLRRIPLSRGVMARTVRTGEPVLLEDAHSDPDFLDAIQGIVSEVCVPLFDEAEVVGTLNVESTEGVALTREDLRLMVALGEHVGIALGRARLHEQVRQGEERHRALVENIPAVVYIDAADETNSVIYRSPYVREVLGYEPEEFLSGPEFWQNLLHPDDRERVLAENERTNETGEPFRIEYRMIRKDGEAVWLRDEAFLIRDEEGRPKFWQGYFVDITDRKKAEEALRDAEERYRTLVESSPESIAVHDGKKLLFINPAGARLFGADAPEELVGKEVLDFVHPDDRAVVASRVREVLEGSESTPLLEERYLRLDGGVVDAEVAGEPITYAGKPAVQAVLRDVTGRKRMEEELRHRATHDLLTGLPNRRLLMERLRHALGRRGGSVALLFLDLDSFKVINDSLGHEAGDRLLVAAAERIGGAVRPSDTVARLGGDEFVVLLEDTGREGSARTAQRVLAALESPFSVEGHELRASASIGVALGGGGRAVRPDELLREADLAMYRAKEEGKARYVVYDPGMDVRARERLELRSSLLRALERREFVLRYQPVVSLASGEVVGLEALLRWEHRERGTLPPAAFLSEAEDMGLAGPLFSLALGDACRLAASLDRGGDTPEDTSPWFSVNLSPLRLHDPDLVDEIARVLSETDVEAGKLVLEITEDAAVEGGEEAAIGRIKGLGACVAIDDFGTGHSSLPYLERLPADFLKLDRTFVAGLEGGGRKPAVVRGMVALAHALDLAVIAEGVETEAQLEVLREVGCDLAQGYLFAEALAAKDAAELFLGTRTSDGGYRRPRFQIERKRHSGT